MNPKHVWDRLAELAAKYGIKPIPEDSFPLIGAYDSMGNFYDVKAVIAAVEKGMG
jgi:hypothetical protein